MVAAGLLLVSQRPVSADDSEADTSELESSDENGGASYLESQEGLREVADHLSSQDLDLFSSPDDEPAPSTEGAPAEAQAPAVQARILPNGPAKSAVTPQQISLPKGEGSIEGMGETFTPQLSSGAANYSVPLQLPPGRNGVGPSLALTYSSSAGNGTLGIGWSIGVPFISRQTDKGLPRYVDRELWHVEEDRFMYNGGQELVPVDNAAAQLVDGAPVPAEFQGWQQYRARVEGAFMRFFRAPDLSRWVVQSKDGTRFEFGRVDAPFSSDAALQSDPEDPDRVFAWHLTRMSDVWGSTVYYEYLSEAGQVYLSDVYYDSPSSCAASAPASRRACTAGMSQYAKRIRFVYEARQDTSVAYTTTWRVENRLRVSRVEITSAADEVGQRYLVRRYHFKYQPDSYHSLLASVQVEGRPTLYDTGLGVNRGVQLSEEGLGDAIVGSLLPPLRFSYTEVQPTTEEAPGFGGIDATVRSSGASPDHSADEGAVDLFDVNADGLPDLLVTDPAEYDNGVGVYFNGFPNGMPGVPGDFSAGVRMGVTAGLSGVLTLSNLNIVPMDVDGDGRVDVLHMPRESSYGYFVVSRTPQPSNDFTAGWSFAYVQRELGSGIDPRIDLGKDGLAIKTVDVNNDHLIDVVRTTGTSIQTWLNLGFVPGGDGRFGHATYSGTAWSLSTDPIETCLPFAGRSVDFADEQTRLADMNGDGLLDIVRIGFGEVTYWPGRGEGAWGDGPRSCDDSGRESRHIVMENPPMTLNAELDGIHLTDVNADGAADLLEVGFDTVSVWFNRLGSGFADRIIAHGTVLNPSALDRVRIADIDGTGTTDIIYAQAGEWRWIDPMGGRKPRLLATVDNGLGALSSLTYSSSAEDYLRDLTEAQSCSASQLDCFTWHPEPLAPGESEGRCDLKVEDECVHRPSGSPVISTVVREMTSTDRMEALGVASQVSTTRFAYHDGYYEGIEQEFRGFGAADTTVLGSASEPSHMVRSYFHQGRRPNSIAADRLADNPNEALKGSEYLSETLSTDWGNYHSSKHVTFAVRRLLRGLNGVAVSYAYEKQIDELKYSAYVRSSDQTLTFPSVVREVAAGSRTGVAADEAREGDAPIVLPIRNATYAHIRATTDQVDNVGHVLQSTAHGRLRDSYKSSYDERIVSVSVPLRVDDTGCGNSGWLWRMGESFVRGPDASGPRLGRVVHHYGPCGQVAWSDTHADLPVQGAFDFTGSSGTLSYDQLSQVLVSSQQYDSWGQPIASCVGANLGTEGSAACLRYATVERDDAYAALVVRESNASGVSAGGFSYLVTTASWDRGLGAVESVSDPNGLTSKAFYDGLGRITGTLSPNVVACAGRNVPNVRIFYDLTSDPAGRPLSRVHEIVEQGCELELDMLESYAYVDGFGRVRATLEEGDRSVACPSRSNWIRGGLAQYTPKGQVEQAYQADLYSASPTSYGDILRNPSSFVRATIRDPFGRVSEEIAEDSTRTWTYYYDSSIEVFDHRDADWYDFPAGGTPRAQFYDGHGRVVLESDYLVHVDSSNSRYVTLETTFREDGAITRMVRRASGRGYYLWPGSNVPDQWVARNFYYDTAGRRIASSDPDTDNRSAGLQLGQRTWRYLYNQAGDLSAVRDPRGCGENFFYDRAGRLVGEQYVGCAEAQAPGEQRPGSVPEGSVGLALLQAAADVDAQYDYDQEPSWSAGVLPGGRSGTLGRPTGALDRGQRTALAYDDRGNVIFSAKQMAMIAERASYEPTPSASQSGAFPNYQEGAESVPLVAYDEAHTYVTRSEYDHAGRVRAVHYPTDPDYPDVSAPQLSGHLAYNERGLVAQAWLVSDLQGAEESVEIVHRACYTRDGLPEVTEYGGTASVPPVFSETLYDSRRRAIEARTWRTPTAGAQTGTLAAVTEIVNQRFVWDAVSNLTDIYDQRPGSEWPAGHRPQTMHMVHDSMYRVEGVLYEYADDDGVLGDDIATDWRDTQEAHVEADPMESRPAGMLPVLPAERVASLTYEYDWLANMVEWGDDAHSFYERSLGGITNGASLSTNTDTPALRPSALYLAANLDPVTAADRGGWLEIGYGVSGNVLEMTVHARCVDTTPATQSCRTYATTTDLVARKAQIRSGCTCSAEQHYSYRYDELNRLSEARRFDRESGAWELKVRQRYRYDSENQRTIKETLDVDSNDARVALFVTPGDFERRGLSVGDDSYEAIVDDTETQYVIAGARVVWKNDDPLVPALDPDHRVSLAVGDLLGSTSAVVDLLSGELLEASSYYPTGAREQWLDSANPSALEIGLEPVGFTGKEADEEVGLTYFGERYLIQRIARWATPDPAEVHAIGGGEALNSFHYVSGSLLQALDPLGLQPRVPKGPITGVPINEPIFPNPGVPLDKQQRNHTATRGPGRRFAHQWLPELIEYAKAPKREPLRSLDTNSRVTIATGRQIRPGVFVFRIERGNEKPSNVAVGVHEEVKKGLAEYHKTIRRTGFASHHMNQSAVFRRIVAERGIATPLSEAEHAAWHESMRNSMREFAPGGRRAGDAFTVRDYNAAARRAYESIGKNSQEVDFLMEITRREQSQHGYRQGDALPLPQDVAPGPRVDPSAAPQRTEPPAGKR